MFALPPAGLPLSSAAVVPRPPVASGENFTLLPKSTLKANAPDASSEREIPVKKGEAVAGLKCPPGAEPDAELSFVTRDLASILPRAKIAVFASREDVIARVRDIAAWTGSNPSWPITALAGTTGSGQRLVYAAEGDIDP